MMDLLKKLSLLVLSKESSEYSFLNKYFEKITFLSDGLEGFNFIQQNNLDIIFLDVNLYNINGLELLSNIRKINKKVSIILFNDVSNVYLLSNCLKYNAEFIHKPINKEYLLMKVINLSEKIKEDYDNLSKMVELNTINEFILSKKAILKIDQYLNSLFFNDLFLKIFSEFKTLNELFVFEEDRIDFLSLLEKIKTTNSWAGNLFFKINNYPIKLSLSILFKHDLFDKKDYFLLIFQEPNEDLKNLKKHFIKKNCELLLNNKKNSTSLESQLYNLTEENKKLLEIVNEKEEELNSLLSRMINVNQNNIETERQLNNLKELLLKKEESIVKLEDSNLELRRQLYLHREV